MGRGRLLVINLQNHYTDLNGVFRSSSHERSSSQKTQVRHNKSWYTFTHMSVLLISHQVSFGSECIYVDPANSSEDVFKAYGIQYEVRLSMDSVFFMSASLV